MDRLQEILEFNAAFVAKEEYKVYETDKFPTKEMVILTCMDTRLIELLPKAMNLKNGDAKIVKNAGAVIMDPYGSIMRSILVAIYELKAKEVYVIGHYGCGMSAVNGSEIVNKMKNRGIREECFKEVEEDDIVAEKWLHGFDSIEESVKESVKRIKEHPLFPSDVLVHGLLIDPLTGKLDCVIE